MWRGRLIFGRDAHKTGQRQIHRAAGGNKPIQIGGQNACLLRFGPGVYLDEQQRTRPIGLRQFRQLFGQRRAINGVDGVKQIHRQLGFVGLQRADHMHLHVGKRGTKRGPFARRLLHIIFAKHPVPCGQNAAHPCIWLHFGNGDQLHGSRAAAVGNFGGTNTVGDFGQ